MFCFAEISQQLPRQVGRVKCALLQYDDIIGRTALGGEETHARAPEHYYEFRYDGAGV